MVCVAPNFRFLHECASYGNNSYCPFSEKSKSEVTKKLIFQYVYVRFWLNGLTLKMSEFTHKGIRVTKKCVKTTKTYRKEISSHLSDFENVIK